MDPIDFYTLEAEKFNALAHPIRLEILELLREGEACVCHIQAMLEQRQAYISQHLNVLRRAGLVKYRKEGLRVYYQVSDPQIFELLDHVEMVLQSAGEWPRDRASSADLARLKQACTCPQCSSKTVQSMS